jgi:hypothetical protein
VRTLAAIRTHKWTEEEERLLGQLRSAFGADVAVVFHDRPADVTPPAPVVDLDAGWAAGQGLQLVPDWGWRCGDYFYYALRAARPDYDAYWLVEPDVLFTADAAGFFARFADAPEDALGHGTGPFPHDIRFTRGLPGLAHHRAIFALTRFSGRALDRLVGLRRAMAGAGVPARIYPNDEIFTFSHVAADPDLTWGRIEAYAPDWFDGTQFATDPDLLFDLAVLAPGGRVLHPVRSRAAFKASLGRRLGGNTGMLLRMRGSLDLLRPEEIDEVAEIAADEIRKALARLRTPRAARRRRGAET